VDDLFPLAVPPELLPTTPLAARLRPRTLDEILGQTHLLAAGQPLRRLIEVDQLSSLLLYGPPGVGKTTLAEVIALTTKSRFEKLNAVEASITDVRRILQAASTRLRREGTRTILFIDEIHRFNKTQQDALLPDVETGEIRLIGATTLNPSYYINGPLVSRSQVFTLEPLDPDSLVTLLNTALQDHERGLAHYRATLSEEARAYLIHLAEGDARRLLNNLEWVVLSTVPEEDGTIFIDLAILENCFSGKIPHYDRNEEHHYDTISAFIKSVRGSDPDAALYWLAKMILAGEDQRFIARRLIILASEDIGLADPHALPLAVAAQQAIEFIGPPESRIPLAEATVYLATAPKSNAAYVALNEAMARIKKDKTIPVPKPLRDSSSSTARQLGHGKNYQYSHDYPEAISPQDFGVAPYTFYRPTARGYEKTVKERLERWVALKQQRPA
jgi:putative ATPase